MPQKNTLFLTILLATALITLAACSSGSGYTYQPWEFNREGEPQAAQKPNQISTPSEYGTEQPQAQTPQSPHDSGPQIQNIPYNTDNTREKLPPVKVGLLLPLSGQHQNLGQSMLKAAQMALFDIGYDSFELVPRDTKGTRAGAKEAARTALTDGAQLILGPVFADSVRAVKEETKSSNVNVIGFSTNWSLAGDNTYIMGFLPFDQIERVLGYASRNNLNRIAIIAPASEYGRVVVSATESIAPKIGLQLSKVKTYPPGTNNLSLTVREFTGFDNPNQTSAPFDAVFMPVGGNEAIAMAGLLSEYGLQPNEVKRLGTGLFDDINLARENSLNSSIFAAPS
ncbi:penicillin-binding protein activator, partial [Alphaproteobacteria bacterium]|nr:penicillin-binding protein activator [Alphaproteobacteria bacterium]